VHNKKHKEPVKVLLVGSIHQVFLKVYISNKSFATLNFNELGGMHMLNFEIIEPQEKLFKSKIVTVMEKKMKIFQGEGCSLKNRSKTFIVAQGWEKGLIGGACLLKKRLSDVQEDVRELLATLVIYEECVWECSCVCLEVSSKFSTSAALQCDQFFQNFYRGLYEKLVEFGRRKNLAFIIMKLTQEAYEATKEFGFWPYVVELKPETTLDGFFHGVLPLTGSQYEAYQKIWERE
jgi:hypothetical protein